MFYWFEVTEKDTRIRHLVEPHPDGSISTWIDTPHHPNAQRYLAWVAAGNTAQEWQPEDAD